MAPHKTEMEGELRRKKLEAALHKQGLVHRLEPGELHILVLELVGKREELAEQAWEYRQA